MANSMIKKFLKGLLGKGGSQAVASMHRRTKPKPKKDKPVAFLLGFSNWRQHHIKEYLRESQRETGQIETISRTRESEFWKIPNEKQANIGIFSKGIQQIPNLQSFLRGQIVFNPQNAEQIQMVAGWGMKESAQKALTFSKENNLPYISLEDGFIRSVGLGVEGSPPLSLCIDHIGIYYDATRPSRLEQILNHHGWEDAELLKQARSAIDFILANRLSKYNHAPLVDSKIFKDDADERVLVVDQTLGDMSITLGLAEQKRFQEMYQQARNENPNAHIYIKTHPDVITGKKQGNITNEYTDELTTFIYEDCNPISLLEYFHKVYVVTSQLGFEALLLKKEVHCFGMPFYAGWGLTRDRLTCERRILRRSVEEVFAAAYLIYPRYIHPRTGKPGTIFDVIHFLAEQKNIL
jgi:capsular polysaccharide export protein